MRIKIDTDITWRDVCASILRIVLIAVGILAGKGLFDIIFK